MKARTCFSVVLCAMLLLGFSSACKSNTAKSVTIVLADDSWDSNLFHNALGKIVIENAYDGYNVEYSTASSAMNLISIKSNDVDLHLEGWTDVYPSYDEDVKAGLIIPVGVILEDSRQAVYVPRYVV